MQPSSAARRTATALAARVAPFSAKVGAAKVGAATIGVALVLLAGATAQARGPVRVAVLPVVVHAVGDHDYLRDGLSDMLAARLGRNGALAVIRVEDPARATTQAKSARKLAQELGADYALFGSFTRFGEGASLDVQCLKVEGEHDARSIFIQSGTLGQIIPRVDELADKIVRYISGAAPAAPPALTAEAPAAGSDGEAALRDALSELRAVQERLDRLEEQVYRSGDEAISETDPAPADGVPDGALEAPGQELSSARGEPAPLP